MDNWLHTTQPSYIFLDDFAKIFFVISYIVYYFTTFRLFIHWDRVQFACESWCCWTENVGLQKDVKSTFSSL